MTAGGAGGRDSIDAAQLVGVPCQEVSKRVRAWLAEDLPPAADDAIHALVEAVCADCRGGVLGPGEAAQLGGLLVRWQADEPLAYLVGSTVFRGRRFAVDPRAHIPRPKMSVLIDGALEAIDSLRGRRTTEDLVAVDVGTGCGAIAITVSLEAPQLSLMYATDISTQALEVASQNCWAHGVEDRVALLAGDLLVPLPRRVDLVIANLPFVAWTQRDTLAPGVAEYEPNISVFGEDDGWGLQRRLLTSVERHVTADAMALITLHVSQESGVRRFLRATLPRAEYDFAPLDPGWSEFVRIRLP